MKSNILKWILAVTASITLPLYAKAGYPGTFEDISSSGWYASAFVGYSEAGKKEVTNGLGAKVGSFGFKPAWGGGVSVGRIINQWRLEVEGAYRFCKHDSSSTPSWTNLTSSGKLHTGSLMANAFYDIPLSHSWSVYLGGGLGIVLSDHELEYTYTVQNFLISGKTTHFSVDLGAQLMAGVAYEINPTWVVTLGYKFFASSVTHFNGVDFGVRIKL